MVVTYTILGRQVGAHVLALTTLGTTFAGIYLAMPAKTKVKESGPPINAASKDEEKFIQYADIPRPVAQRLPFLKMSLRILQRLPEECERWWGESKGMTVA
ncbi:MAG: hypothetical protein Q9166_002998 [cf. Caloplaca sp. 2 TL-2023]